VIHHGSLISFTSPKRYLFSRHNAGTSTWSWTVHTRILLPHIVLHCDTAKHTRNSHCASFMIRSKLFRCCSKTPRREESCHANVIEEDPSLHIETMRAVKAAHPLDFVPILPGEIWLRIMSFLAHEDLVCLACGSRCFMWLCIMYADESTSIAMDHELIIRRLHRDWYRTPDYQTCIMCDRKHRRCLAQPRYEKPAKRDTVIGCVRDDGQPCLAGLRFTADKILCQTCWSRILSDKTYKNGTPRSWPIFEEWSHEWRIERSGKALILLWLPDLMVSRKTMSRLQRGSEPSSLLLRRLAGVPSCGCSDTAELLLQRILWHLQNRFTKSYMTYLNQGREILVCEHCNAAFAIRALHKADGRCVLYVPRYQKLGQVRQHGGKDHLVRVETSRLRHQASPLAYAVSDSLDTSMMSMSTKLRHWWCHWKYVTREVHPDFKALDQSKSLQCADSSIRILK
jgi:hypothetical protein